MNALGSEQNHSHCSASIPVAGRHGYDYDAAGRLTAANHPDAQAATNPDESYSYDGMDNRTSSVSARPAWGVPQPQPPLPSGLPIVDYGYDDGYRLATDSVYIYTYDANGNQTQKVRREDGAAWSYTYDAEDRMTNAVLADASGTVFVVATYTYDLAGRRTSKEVNGAVTRYEYDGLALVAEYGADGSRTARWFYPPGAIDSPTAMERGGRLFLYVYDERGSVVSITDEQGNELQRYEYDAFGRVTLSQGQVANPFLFTGREYDPETGLYFYRARVYDPDTGRFLQQDPVFSLNLYPYAGNDPVNNSDPLGLTFEVRGPYSDVSSSAWILGVEVPNRITMTWFARGTEDEDAQAVIDWMNNFCEEAGLTEPEECHCGSDIFEGHPPDLTREQWAGKHKGACSINIKYPWDCGDGGSGDGEGEGSKPPTTPKQPPKGNPQVGGNNGGGGRPNPNNGGTYNDPNNPWNWAIPWNWSGNGDGYDEFKKDADKVAKKLKDEERNRKAIDQINRLRHEKCVGQCVHDTKLACKGEPFQVFSPANNSMPNPGQALNSHCSAGSGLDLNNVCSVSCYKNLDNEIWDLPTGSDHLPPILQPINMLYDLNDKYGYKK